jgi:hypothetical protein
MADDPVVARAASVWLERQTHGEAHDWIEELTQDWMYSGERTAMWQFVLELCATAPSDNSDVIDMIGVGPLYDIISQWPESALSLIDGEVDHNPTLLQALGAVITSTPSVRGRIDAMLVRNGEAPFGS